MNRAGRILAGALVLTFVIGATAWGEQKVTITREENKPKNVDVKVGEDVRFINFSAQTAHVWFGGEDAPRFFVPAGSGGAKVKFEKPGIYEYSVHITGGKVHAHTGSVVVK
jgi:plastocyanin